MNNTVLLDCITGSRAYNLATPTSDYDRRKVVTPVELAYFFGLKTFDVGNVTTTKENDNTDYSLRKFMQLLVNCNTVMLEMLFAPKECQTEVHPLFEKYFLNNKEKFVTKKLFKTVQGYAVAEFRRAMGETTRDLGERRKTDIEVYGYSPKNASHCIRLLNCATEALKTGVFPVWLEGDIRDYCYLLKTCQVDKETFVNSYNNYVLFLEYAHDASTLPEEPDMEYLNKLLVGFYTELLGDDMIQMLMSFRSTSI